LNVKLTLSFALVKASHSGASVTRAVFKPNYATHAHHFVAVSLVCLFAIGTTDSAAKLCNSRLTGFALRLA
jgi:hypothetical protein